ncbi:ubiquitin-CONJUGAT-2 domain-containing protein [Favolaschia claudopus]|uniref:Ubiquitin-CONJUGAT-2 domain-containing protein n=1 Tax=Favolaschia claudopus TaxID=2862362 RepID=A0AAW0DB61_9AGAR
MCMSLAESNNLPQIDQDYGGPIEIGEAVTVWFARESDLQGNRVSETDRKKRTRAGDAIQAALADEWEKDPRPVQVIQQTISEVGPLLQTTKSSHPSPKRLHRIEEKNFRWTSTYKQIRDWQCQRCTYGTEKLPHCVAAGTTSNTVDAGPSSTPPSSCHLDQLSDDDIYELALRLPSESLTTFSAAYPRLHNIVESVHLLVQRELRCFFLRTGIHYSVLGIGVAFDPRTRILSSDFDWLSQRAFTDYGIRKSVQKRDFTFFLPLAFSREHFTRVHPQIWKHLEEIDSAVQKAAKGTEQPQRSQRHEVVAVVYRMMTNIVVSLMKSCDTAYSSGRRGAPNPRIVHASEKAVVAYCHLFHLVISLCRTDPQILDDATTCLRNFIEHETARMKTEVPDLGELIVLFMLVSCCPPVGSAPPITWEQLAWPFLEEVLIRNSRWILKDTPCLEIMEEGPSEYRLAETLLRSKTSLRLVMFQITFLDMFSKAYGASGDITRLDNNYGFPEPEFPERMVEEAKAMYAIDAWPAFFEKVRCEQGAALSTEELSEILRGAIKTSETRQYHNPAPKKRQDVLRGQKKRAEEGMRAARRRAGQAGDEELEVFKPF